MYSILMRLATTIMVLLAIAQAPQAFAAQAQAQEIVSDLPEERRVVNSEGPGPAATSVTGGIRSTSMKI